LTYVAADGPPDIDAVHQWAPATGTAPPALHAPTTDPLPTLPWIKVTAIDGWRDLPEIVDNRAPRTFGVGEVAYPARVLGKTLVYQCEIRAASRETVRNKLSLCLAGFGTDLNEGVMTVTPYTAPGGVVFTYTARVIALDADSAWTPNLGSYAPYRWGFTLSLRMSDPKFYTSGTGYL
jgi:hypothetical protein